MSLGIYSFLNMEYIQKIGNFTSTSDDFIFLKGIFGEIFNN